MALKRNLGWERNKILVTNLKYRTGPVSTEWKGPWKSCEDDPEVAGEAYEFASESLDTVVKAFDNSIYIRGDFFGDRTLYVEVESAGKVTEGLLKVIQNWLVRRSMWRVVIPVGRHEEAYTVYGRMIFRGTEEIGIRS